jgi:two-component system chemotaxis response regulator CheB
MERLQEDQSREYHVVAIGSSAGGIRALMTVLPAFPSDLSASVLVVQHLDPKATSQLVDILARHTAIPVVQAEDGQEIHPGTVYIAPPARHMLVEQDHIRLTTTELVHFVRPSIDLLFESVAATFGRQAIGVILTGSGLDGGLGTQAIRANGGLMIVQDPATAESTGMPSTAIRTGAVDLILPLEEIGPRIVDLVRGGKAGRLP